MSSQEVTVFSTLNVLGTFFSRSIDSVVFGLNVVLGLGRNLDSVMFGSITFVKDSALSCFTDRNLFFLEFLIGFDFLGVLIFSRHFSSICEIMVVEVAGF